MALKALLPISFKMFANQVQEHVPGIIGCVTKHRGDWLTLLKRYCYRGYDWECGCRVRRDFHSKLRAAAVDRTSFQMACGGILSWGGMNQMDHTQLQQTYSTCLELDRLDACAAPVNLEMIMAKRIASSSKIYEMWQPQSWIIYDSYSSRGFARMISPYWNDTGNEHAASYLRFPQAIGRGQAATVGGFPSLGFGAVNQARLAFIYASWLSRLIAEHLRSKNDDFKWEAFHVEMVAFVIGHG